MTSARPWLACALAVALCCACSLVLNFSPEGQPCSAQGTCVAGYACIAGTCRASACDGGACAGSCAGVLCPVGKSCQAADGGTSCVAVSSASLLGYACASDSDCGTGRLCLHGEIALEPTGGALRPGVCVESCLPGQTCSGPEHATCRAFHLALDAGSASFCLPDALAASCTRDADCADAGLTCTVFDHPKLGPVTLCDAPLDGGVPERADCIPSPGADGGQCANGLCLPQQPLAGQRATCASPCETNGDCPNGSRCGTGEFIGFGSTLRHVPVCIPGVTTCVACTASSAQLCGVDAPHCVSVSSTSSRCLSECNSNPGQGLSCPPGESCTPSSVAGAMVCVPLDAGTACQ